MATKIKRGDTFTLTGTLTQNGAPVDITGWTLHSDLLWSNRTREVLVAEIVSGPAGTFTVSALPVDTANWPIGAARCDIRFVSDAENVRTTETFEVTVEQEITQLG